jgi:hypothetical protein
VAGRSRRRAAIAAGAGSAALAAIVVAVVLLVSGDDGGGGDAAPSTSAGESTTTTIGAEGEQLIALLTQGLNTDYHARYSAAGEGGVAGAEGSFVAELWRKGQLFRQDSTVIAQGQPQQLSAFLLPDRSVGCRRVGTDPWLCDPIPESSVGKIQEQLVQAAVELATVIVSVTDTEIAGHAAQCFAFDPTAVESQEAGAVEEVCLTTDGLPARLVSTAQTLELELLEFTVDDAAFVPPG